MKCLKIIVCLGDWHHVQTQKTVLTKNNYYMCIVTWENKTNNWPAKEFISIHVNCPQK